MIEDRDISEDKRTRIKGGYRGQGYMGGYRGQG